MRYKNQFVIVSENKVISQFDCNILYDDREEAIFEGQVFCRAFAPEDNKQTIYFRTILTYNKNLT